MEVKRWELMPHVYLTYLPARKFKTGVLSAQFITPLAKETASYNALLPAVLHRGTMRCPDMEQLAAAMDRLYGAQISPTIRKRGETQCLGFVASFIDDRFVSRTEPLLEPAAELLGELLLDPVTRGGRFLQEYVEGEKANLADAIRSIRNDKRDWADLRLLQEMCAGEPYGISRFGDEAGLAKINNQQPADDVLLPAGAVLLRQRRVPSGGGGPADGLLLPDPWPPNGAGAAPTVRRSLPAPTGDGGDGRDAGQALHGLSLRYR